METQVTYNLDLSRYAAPVVEKLLEQQVITLKEYEAWQRSTRPVEKGLPMASV